VNHALTPAGPHSSSLKGRHRLSAAKKHRTTNTQSQDGRIMPSQVCLGVLLESIRSAWEGPEDPASCAWRFLACVATGNQEERLHRLLSFVEVMRGALVERLGGQEQYRGGDAMVQEASRKRGRCGGENGQKKDGRSEVSRRVR
jgi:hypothetical protein